MLVIVTFRLSFCVDALVDVKVRFWCYVWTLRNCSVRCTILVCWGGYLVVTTGSRLGRCEFGLSAVGEFLLAKEVQQHARRIIVQVLQDEVLTESGICRRSVRVEDWGVDSPPDLRDSVCHSVAQAHPSDLCSASACETRLCVYPEVVVVSIHCEIGICW